jgi:DHA3 family macrolide efflux protein-like MFS transporter
MFSVFHKRDFTLLWTAQLVSTAGSSLTDLAAGILVFRLTGSALSVGLMLMATALPSLAVGLLAGVFVDRYDRKRIMVGASLIQGCLVASIPFLIGFNVVWLYVIVLLNASVKQFFDPAREAVIPDLATDEELAAANSFLSIADFGSTAVGFAAAGLIASRFPIEWAFWTDAATFFFCAAAVSLIRVGKVVAEGDTTVRLVFENLRGGIATLVGTPILRSLLVVSIPAFFAFGLWNVLLLPFTIKVLGASEFEYGLQEGLTSLGFVVGSFFMARFADRFREGTWIAVSMLGMGVFGVLYGLATSVPIAILMVIITGFMNAPSSIARRTLLQRSTVREMRGRVFAGLFVTRDVVFLLGMGAAGLADLVDIRVLVIASSLVLVGAGIATALAPGLGRPAASWLHAMRHLEATGAAPAMADAHVRRPATLADFDLLISRLPTFGLLDAARRAAFVHDATVDTIDGGTRVITKGDMASDAYFILEGTAVAGFPDGSGGYRGLSTMGPGDFFGEIGALTASPRTADVVAQTPMLLLEVPAEALRAVMAVPEVNRLILSTLTERLVRTNSADLPRVAAGDQSVLRELRTPVVEASAVVEQTA